MDSPDSSGDRVDTLAQSVKSSRTTARRTHRACDRCRVKKSKCNGQQPCNTCKANERTCVFSALRRRDIRKWHCHMQDTVDEAIQRLYRACRASGSFPGTLPEEIDGYVTTESILQGMGFANLDLGPRAAESNGVVAMQQLPFRQRLAQGAGRGPPLRLLDVHVDTKTTGKSNSDAASMDSARTSASPLVPLDLQLASEPHKPYHQYESVSDLSMHEQFRQAVGDSTMANQKRQPYHHHYQQPQQPQQYQHQLYRHDPEQQQYIQQFHQQSYPLMTSHPSTPLTPNPKSPHTLNVYDTGHNYPAPSYYVYNDETFVNPGQIWQAPSEVAPVSQ